MLLVSHFRHGRLGRLAFCREYIATVSVLPRRTSCRRRSSPRGYGPERANGSENPLRVSARERNAQLPDLSRCYLAVQARPAHYFTQPQSSARRSRIPSPGLLFPMPQTPELSAVQCSRSARSRQDKNRHMCLVPYRRSGRQVATARRRLVRTAQRIVRRVQQLSSCQQRSPHRRPSHVRDASSRNDMAHVRL